MANMRHDETMNTEHAELERWLRKFDDPHPTPHTVEAARRAVRVALDEEWLARGADPVPSPDVTVRVRESVRRELGGERAAVLRIRLFWRTPAFGGLAAAAAIVAAVTVGWMTSGSAPGPTSPQAQMPTALNAFEQALDADSDDMDVQLAAIDEELGAFEAEWSGGYGATDWWFGDDAGSVLDDDAADDRGASGAGDDL